MRTWSIALPVGAGLAHAEPELPPRREAVALSPWLEGQARTIWAAMVADRRWAGPTLARLLRETRALGSHTRRTVGDTLLGFVRHESALARVAPDPFDAWRILATAGIPDLDDPADPVDACAIAVSLPRWIAAEWWDALGPAGATALARTLGERAPVVLRWLRPPIDLPVPHTRLGPHTLRLDAPCNLDLLPAFRDGRCIVQDLGSQEVVDALFPEPGHRILDACAGAGGKSIALAAMGFEVQAWDLRPAALAELRRRAARAGVEVHVAPPAGRYDTVLLDAPCSGTGVLRRHPENRWKLDFPTDAQEALLRDAVSRADRVVYATCALTRRENEDLVRRVATPHHDRRLWPEPGGRDGYYIADLRG